MKKSKKFNFKKIFFIGIGGISMSGLCKMCKLDGIEVLGSDISFNEETAKLEKLGVKVFHSHSEDNIDKSIDLIVYSGAIHSENVEIIKAQSLGIRLMERSEFLGILASSFTEVIAISGTHGKTTTTAILGEILQAGGLAPTIHLGGESVNLKDNTIIGKSDILVLEACEYRESFRFLNPDILAITNIDADHLDYYKDLDDIKGAFDRIAKKSEVVVSNGDYPNAQLIMNRDFSFANCKFENNGYNFDVMIGGKSLGTFRLNMIGMHNVVNALFAITIADFLGVDPEVIRKSVENFGGVKRRYEKIGEISGIPFIIDYAHHPTEIASSIGGINSCYSHPLVVFQPHTYSRTKSLMTEFVQVLKGSDLYLYETYPAREKEILDGRCVDLYENLIANNEEKKKILYFDDYRQMYLDIGKNIRQKKYDCILILGAGNLAENFRTLFNL